MTINLQPPMNHVAYEMNLDAIGRLGKRQNSPQPGLEPGNPAYEAGVMTITLPRSMDKIVL